MMGTMKAFLLLAAAACVALAGSTRLATSQDKQPEKKPETGDFLYLQDRSVVKGEILQYAASGRLSVKTADGAKPVDIALEEVARLRFSSDESRPATPSGEQARLAGGGTVCGKIVSFGEDTAVVAFCLTPLAPRPELGHVDTEPLPSAFGTPPDVGAPQ